MYFYMAVVANHHRFAPLGYHYLLPAFFAFEVFHLVYMVNFVALSIIATAQLTHLGLQSVRERGLAVCVDGNGFGYYILARFTLYLAQLCDEFTLCTCLCFVWDAPTLVTGLVLGMNL